MKEGWDATGLLRPLWGTVGGRDALAELTGIGGGTLSGYNTGRLRLGQGNAERIAAALEISIMDLGAPAAKAGEQGQRVVDHLEELAAGLADAAEKIVRLNEEMVLLQERVTKLEARRAPGRAASRRARGQ